MGKGENGGAMMRESLGETFAQLSKVYEFAEDFDLVVAAAMDDEAIGGKFY